MNTLIAGAEPAYQSDIKNPVITGVLQNLFEAPDIGIFLSTLLPNLVGVGFVVGTVIFFFMLLMGSIQWISSGGDKSALEGARSKLTNALVGIILLFASFAIIKLIETFFGINILTIDIGPLIIQ